MLKVWISQKLGCRESDIDKLYNSKTALEFLMVWSLFETHCFGTFMKKDFIEEYSKKFCSDILIETLDEEFIHFYKRYQNKNYYRNLKHKENFTVADNLLRKPVKDSSGEEKLSFLIYVVYRYRNNMFHGNKRLDSWLSYKTQINYCVNVMTKVIDNHVKKELEIA